MFNLAATRGGQDRAEQALLSSSDEAWCVFKMTKIPTNCWQVKGNCQLAVKCARKTFKYFICQSRSSWQQFLCSWFSNEMNALNMHANASPEILGNTRKCNCNCVTRCVWVIAAVSRTHFNIKSCSSVAQREIQTQLPHRIANSGRDQGRGEAKARAAATAVGISIQFTFLTFSKGSSNCQAGSGSGRGSAKLNWTVISQRNVKKNSRAA